MGNAFTNPAPASFWIADLGISDTPRPAMTPPMMASSVLNSIIRGATIPSACSQSSICALYKQPVLFMRIGFWCHRLAEYPPNIYKAVADMVGPENYIDNHY
jgi:hypothetical protein